MNLGLIAKMVFAAAPKVAASLGGPSAGMAVTLLEKLFHVSADDLTTAIANDPEATIKLQTLELLHSETLHALEVKDRSDARTSAITGKYDWFVHVVSSIVIIGFFATMFFGIYFGKSSRIDQEQLKLMEDVMLTAFIQVLAFYVGKIIFIAFNNRRK